MNENEYQEILKKLNYNRLVGEYEHAKGICDPIEFTLRQKRLLYTIAEYLLERDMPDEERIKRKEEEERMKLKENDE